MKKSDLVSYIKENIRTTLAPQNEASKEEVKNQIDLNRELKKTVDLKKSVGIGIKEDNLDEDMGVINTLKDKMYVDDDNPRQIMIHPLSKPDARRPDQSYIIVKDNNVVAVQGYDSGPIEDLAQAYNLDVSRSSLDPIGQRNATGQASLLSSNILKDAIKAIQDSRDLEAKRQKDYYQSRGPVSGVGNMDENDSEDAPAGDKEIQKKASKNDRIINDFRKIKAKMDTHLAMFKDAEGEAAKNAAKQMLKNLTPEYQAAKKAYDKIK